MHEISVDPLSSFGLLNPPNTSSKIHRQRAIKLIAIGVLALLGIILGIGMAAIGKISIGAAAIICLAIIPCALLINKAFNPYKKNLQLIETKKIANLFTTHLFNEINQFDRGYVSPFEIIEDSLSPQYPLKTGELSVRYRILDKDHSIIIPLKELFESIDWTNPGKAWENTSTTQKRNSLVFGGSYVPGVIYPSKPFIKGYSGSEYATINSFLRTGTIRLNLHQMLRAKCMNRCAKAIFFDCLAISGELKTINPQNTSYRKVTRGAQFTQKQITSLFSGKQTYTELGFFSTTTSNVPPSGFDYKNVQFKISTFSGKSIKKFSGAPHEEEVLLPPHR